MTSEIQAMGGMGRSSSKMGLKMASAQREVPMAMPSTMPMIVATEKPTSTRRRLTSRWPTMTSLPMGV